MNTLPSKLKRKYEVAISALMTEPTIKEAAHKSGLSETTLHRYLKAPEFQKVFREAKAELLGQTTARLQSSAALAIDTLEDVMRNKKAVAMARVTAAKTVLEFVYKSHEQEQVIERIEQLEAEQAREEENEWAN